MKHIFLCLIIFGYMSRNYGQELQEVEPAFEGLIKYPNTRDFTLSDSGDEAYFSIQSPLEEIAIIASIKKKDGVWMKPEMVGFTGAYRDIEPFLSPDQLKLYFASNRPLNDSITGAKDFDIWYVKRDNIDASWSQPINVGTPINTKHGEFYPSVSKYNNLYFTSDNPEGSKGKDDIYFSAWNGSSHEPPVSLSESINTAGYEYNAFIAQDESYILYGAYNRKDGLGSGDIYISYRNEDKTWGTSKNLGNTINSKAMDYCPFVDINSNTLYFTSRRSLMEATKFNSIKDFEKEINKYENGFSRIYKVPFTFD